MNFFKFFNSILILWNSFEKNKKMSNLEKIKNEQNELGEVPVWAMAEKYGPFAMDSKNGF